jgi:cyclopropane-fatty-acyl-phospholipid synthase
MTSRSSITRVSDIAARGLLKLIASRIANRTFDIELWNGEKWCPDIKSGPGFCIQFRSPAALPEMLLEPGARSFAEAFVHGLIDIDGPLIDVFGIAEELMRIEWSAMDRVQLAGALALIPRFDAPTDRGRYGGFATNEFDNPTARRRASVNYHYDHSVDFWRLWLDETLSYSCAYFKSDQQSLDQAQEAKLDLVCRKLRLRPGMSVLDVGCGWGAFVRHAVANYDVTAVGVTLSPRQANVARQRLQKAGLDHRARIELCDFFDLPSAERYDRIASVGSVEHIPEKSFSAYFHHAYSLLKPGGHFLNHGITRTPTVPDRPGPSFMNKYIFPDHYLASIGQTISAAEAAGFEVRDVENLREHYAITLQHWLRRYELARTEIESLIGQLSYRIFRLYLAGSAYEFLRGRLSLHQTLLAKSVNGASGVPLTRSDWYNNEAENNCNG